jgi:hypothetical protein
MPVTKIVVELSVAKVQSGGNAGKGEYFYSFNTDVILVTQAQTPMEFRLSSDTSDIFTIKSLVSSDSDGQLLDFKFSENQRGLLLLNDCRKSELISLAILVMDNKAQRLILCDPQVINSPERVAN